VEGGREEETHELQSDLHRRRERSPVMKEGDGVHHRDCRASLSSNENSVHERGRVLEQEREEER